MRKIIIILFLFAVTIPSCSREINWKRYWSEYSKYSQSIQKWSEHYGLDTNIVKALISWESGWTPKAKGIPPSCRGLMQVNDGSFDPDKNIKQGCKKLYDALKFYGNYYDALIGYNCGINGAKPIVFTIIYIREKQILIPKNHTWYYSTKIFQIANILKTTDHKLMALCMKKRGLI